MIFSTITQDMLQLTANTYTIPAQYSNNIQIQFEQDNTNFNGWIPTVQAGLYDSSVIECADALQGSAVPIDSSGIITLNNNILSQSGFLVLSITLTSGDENVVLPMVVYQVTASTGQINILPPDTEAWQQAVQAFTQTLFDNYTSETVQPILDDAQQALTNANQAISTANQQQQQIDSAISQMGEYQIVSEDPVQIQFKQGDGTYGQTVDLGDGLASKSMVNAGYYQSQNSVYSDSASVNGIEVAQIQGAYVQDGTPTPTAPIEPQFVEIENFYSYSQNILNSDEYYGSYKSGDVYTATNAQFNSIKIPIPKQLIGKSLMFSADLLNGQNISYILIVATINGIVIESNSVSSTTKYTNAYVIFTPVTENDHVIISYGSGNGTVSAKNIMLAISDTEIPYVPYQGSNQQLSSPLNLPALPNGVCDTWINGQITRNVGSVTFDGSGDETWGLYTSNVTPNHTKFSIKMPSNMLVTTKADKKPNEIICNHLNANSLNDLITSTTNQSNGISVYSASSYIYICLESAIASSVSELKTWLQSNPITVWYQLATPTTEQLAIPTLASFYPFTNAWCDSLVQPQITWNVLTGRSSVLDGNGSLLPQVYMTAPPNGLINGDFMINQRGQSSYVGSASEYVLSVDCWCLDENTGLTVTPNSGGSITLANTSSQALGIYQQLPNLTFPCVAGMKLDGTDAQYFVFEEANTFNVGSNAQIAIVQIGSSYWIKLIANAGQTITIDYADYWHGKLAYKHVNEDISTALIRSLRYVYQLMNGSLYTYIGSGYLQSSQSARVFVELPMPMNSSPSIVYDGDFEIFNGSSIQTPTTGIVINTNFSSFSKIALNIDVGISTTAGEFIVLRASNDIGSSFLFSCEPVPQS